MSHDRYGDTEYNRVPEKYNHMFSVVDGGKKAAGHKMRKFRQLCDTDDDEDDEESHQQTLKILARKRNTR